LTEIHLRAELQIKYQKRLNHPHFKEVYLF